MEAECNIETPENVVVFRVSASESSASSGPPASEPHPLSTGLPSSTQAVVPPLRLRTLP